MITAIIILQIILVYTNAAVPSSFSHDIFYTQHFYLGDQPTGPHTYTLIVPQLQTNITKVALASAEISKNSGYNVRFSATATAAASTTQTFNIDYKVVNVNGLKLGFFLIVLKGQTYSMIDIILINFTNDPLVQNNLNSIRSTYLDVDVSTSSVFSNTTNLQLYPFFTSYETRANVAYVSYNIQATIVNTTFIRGTFQVGPITAVDIVEFFVMIVNPVYINQIIKAQNMSTSFGLDYYLVGTSYSQEWPFATNLSLFGSPYTPRCFMGSTAVGFWINSTAEFLFSLDSSNDIQNFYYNTAITNDIDLHISAFCFTYDMVCTTNQTYSDAYTQLCYFGYSCPLVVPDNWNTTMKCPKCQDIICDKCDPLNRAVCTACTLNSNSNLAGSVCQCDTGYSPSYFPLTPSSIQWVSATTSLKECTINCTYFLAGCVPSACVNLTYCSLCNTGFFVELISASSSSKCTNCTSILTECIQCSDNVTCTKCSSKFVYNTTSSTCQCSALLSNLLHCVTCVISTVCTVCQSYYYASLVSGLCQSCVKLVGNGCLECDGGINCLNCDSTSNLINGKCYICAKEVQYCKNCVVNNLAPKLDCIVCADGYYISPQAACLPCDYAIDNCYTCSSIITCTSCKYPYLVGSTGICDQCILPFVAFQGSCMKQPGCKTPSLVGTKYIGCMSCFSQLHFVFNSSLKKCVCDIGYKLSSPSEPLSTCQSVCGDGVVILPSQMCDDNNTISGDGCSNLCAVEDSFKCLGQPSHCILYANFDTVQYNYAYRVLGENKGYLSFTLLPAQKLFQKVDWSTIINLNYSSQTISSMSYSYNSATGQLLVGVTYLVALQQSNLQTTIIFPATIMICSPPSYILGSKISGINAPLSLDSSSLLQSYKMLSTISTILIVLILIQFYLGSYFHKMIGLETIQVVQVFFFVRMVVKGKATALVTALNMLKYSNGYDNQELFFGPKLQLGTIQASDKLSTMNSGFITVGLQKYFLGNVNLAILPLLIVFIVYVVQLIIKNKRRNQAILYMQQQQKDKYTIMRRRCQRIYNTLIFPYTMSFNMIAFFSTIIFLQSSTSQSSLKLSSPLPIEISSFPFNLLILFITFFLYCLQLLQSLSDYQMFLLPQNQIKPPTSFVAKLEYDQNNSNVRNYHPIYVMVYLVYYFLQMLIMVMQVLLKQFTISLQLLLTIAIIYLILIIYWKPYYQSINMHNRFLILNHGSVVILLIICQIFSLFDQITPSISILLMYLIIILLVLIIIGGYIRIVIEYKFQKSVQQNGASFVNPKHAVQLTPQQKQLARAYLFLQSNPFLFQNQLKILKKKYQINDKLSSVQEQAFIKKINEQTKIQYQVGNSINKIQKDQQSIIKVLQQFNQKSNAKDDSKQNESLGQHHNERGNDLNIQNVGKKSQSLPSKLQIIRQKQKKQQELTLNALKKSLQKQWAMKYTQQGKYWN